MNKFSNYISHLTIPRWISLMISMVIPKNKKLMIFGSWFGSKYADNAKYLFEYVNNERPDINAVWMTKNQKVYEEIKQKGYKVCYSGTIKGIRYAIRAGAVYYCTHVTDDIGIWESHFIGNSKLINLWHGIPLKKIMYDDEFSYLNKNRKRYLLKDKLLSIPLNKQYICSSSPAITKIFSSAFQMDKDHIMEVGMARYDYFYMNHKHTYKERYPGKKIIVYLPTHRKEGKEIMDLSTIFDLDRLNEICHNNNCIFLIKKHYYHHLEEKIDSNKYQFIKEISEEQAETMEILDSADALVTDFSSCYVDYLILDRPIIFYIFDFDKYEKNDRKTYFEGINTEPGPQCRTYIDFENSLKDFFNGEDKFRDERSRIRELFFSDNAIGLASPRIIKYVENIK